MKTLTYSELIERLKLPGAKLIGITTVTDAKLKKTGNPFGEVFKRSRAVAMVGAKYEDAVNRQQQRDYGRDASFKADELPWGEWLVPNKVITHKGELYLRTQSTAGQRRIRPAVVKFERANGHKLAYEDVKPFLPEKSTSAKQEISAAIAKGSKLHGEPNFIDVRNYKFSSIRRVRIDKQTYKLVQD